MYAFTFSMLSLCVIAAFLQFWLARSRFTDRSPIYSIAFASIIASLCLQVLTVGLTLTGFADPESSFMGYFYQGGQLTIGGAIISVLVPTFAGGVLALVSAGLAGTLLRPATQ